MFVEDDIQILAKAIVSGITAAKNGSMGLFDDFASMDNIGTRINSSTNISSEFDELKKDLDGLRKTLKDSQNEFKGHTDTYDGFVKQIQKLEEKLEKLGDIVQKTDKVINNELNKIISEEEEATIDKNRAEAKEINRQATEKNKLYQSEQSLHAVKLLDIEVEAKRAYIKEIKELYKKEEDIRKNGLNKYELNQERLNKRVRLTEQNVANKKGHYSATFDMWNRLIAAPLIKNFGRFFGPDRTETLGTGALRGGAALLGVGDKAMKMAATGKMDVSGMLGGASSKLMSTGNPYAMAAGAVVSILKTAFEMYSKVDKAASDYARKVGGGAVAQNKMRESAATLADEMSKMWGRAYKAETILENMAATSEVLGRNLEYLSTQDLKAITDLKDFGISNATISQFDTLGISIERVSKEFASIYGSAGKKGLNASAVIKSVADNMKLAQNYTFAKGRKAIFEMAEKSAQLKFNLRDAETFANKVSTLEGAMKSAAQLSVLGGSFAMQGNPMTLLYNALNDVEGLQDQMLAMTKDLVYWDRQKGQLEMSAFDRQRLRAMSEATGIDYNELTTQAFNQGRIDRISRQIKPGTDKDTAEYIKNIAFIDEKGNARIQFHDARGQKDGEAKLLSQLTEQDKARLQKESEAKDMKEGATVGDILSSTMTIQDRLDSIIQVLQNYIVKAVMGIADTIAGKAVAESVYGFEGKEKEQFGRIRDLLTDNVISQSDIAKMSYEDKQMLRKMNLLDNSNRWKGRNHTSQFEGDVYTTSEAAQLYSAAIGGQKEPIKYAKGGYTGDGNPNEIAGLVHKGEYVIDADTTKSMFSDIKNGENPMKFKDFAQRVSGGIKNKVDNFIDGHESVKVEFGTLHLELGGITKDVDMNAFADLLLSNHSFIETLIQKMATTRDFGYRKDDAQFKYISHPYTI